jgi:hypothetical protein
MERNQTKNKSSSIRSGIFGISLPMSRLTELDSLVLSNYKDASPTGLRNRQR